MSRIDSRHRKISTGCHFQNGHHNTAQIQHCSISTSWIDSRHRKISTGLHFQNGRHNTAKIQHCSISKVVFSSPDPKGQVSYCHHWASVVCPLTFHILINSSEATGPIWTKLWWNGPWMTPFQNCVRWSRLPTKMAAKLKIEKGGMKF
jgi:hypothetical protein